MNVKMLIGLGAVSLLASCGLFSVPIDVVPRDGVVTQNGGALGLEGKGAPLSLSRGGLTVQAQFDKVIDTGTFGDIKDQRVKDNIGLLKKWGASQDIDTVTLAGLASCSTTGYTFSNISATVKMFNTGAPTDFATKTVNYPSVTLKPTSPDTPCVYNLLLSTDKKWVVDIVLEEPELSKFKKIAVEGGDNSAEISLKFEYPDELKVTNATATFNFGDSGSYVVGGF
jgi:hypothetical protein